MADDPDIEAIADTVLAALDRAAPLAPLAGRIDGLDMAAAYRVTAALRRRRRARGERPVGRKIGFTNRQIWPECGVFAPIWGDLFDSSVASLAERDGRCVLARFHEPRIEPEIAFGLARAPAAGMDEAALLGCVAWVAHGYEIVQSPFPGWRFAAADTVAAGGLHGCLLLGPQRSIAPGEQAAWLERLRGFRLTLARDGHAVDTGHAADVLDGPLSALRHLVGLLAADPANPPLAAGEIVTTGTVTRAFPVAPGETWTTSLDGLPLDGIQVRFA